MLCGQERCVILTTESNIFLFLLTGSEMNNSRSTLLFELPTRKKVKTFRIIFAAMVRPSNLHFQLVSQITLM